MQLSHYGWSENISELTFTRSDLSQLNAEERAAVSSVEDVHVIEHVIDLHFDNLSVGTYASSQVLADTHPH